MLNSVFLTLIPKKEAADQVKDFWPISLIHGFVKLVTKILSNWLVRKLHDLVANSQRACQGKKYTRQLYVVVVDHLVLSPTKAPSHSSQAR
jgi:hypothetical protein